MSRLLHSINVSTKGGLPEQGLECRKWLCFGKEVFGLPDGLQVGYGPATAAAPAARTRRQAARSSARTAAGSQGAEELVKQRLASAVRASAGRGAAAKGQDELREMGLMD